MKKSPLVPRNVALCYVRQSYTRDGNDKDSPERQEANIKAVCEKNGWIMEWYKDADGHKSGRHEKTRPGWLALKGRLGDPDVVALVANDLSRLHRKGWRVGDLVDFVNEHDVALVLAAPGREVDTSTPTGRMFILFSAIFDEYYAEDASIRQKDSVAHRRGRGISVGIPSFGTVRGQDGYLIPSTKGAWYMPDGSWIAGHEGDTPPDEAAVWRGYYACAQQMLTLYVKNRRGYDMIAYLMTKEGWAFKDRHGQPRPITRDDVRRVISAWRPYAGLALPGRAKDQNMSKLENPGAVLFDTGRNVFDLKLIRQVAEVQENRSVTLRPAGAKKVARLYPLTNLLYCAHCEQKAAEQQNPKFRSRLAGWDRYGVQRYRHTEGRACTAHSRSIHAEVVEADFGRLVSLLTIDEQSIALLTELSIQAQFGSRRTDKEKMEEEKKQAIAKCRRRIEAARLLFGDGDISREEYLRRKEQNEREIAHWESRTTETEKLAMELGMCMDAVRKLAQLWEVATDEDKQGMARTLFEYIVVDLDTQRITGFRLKSWAEQFLVLRMALYGDDTAENTQGEENEKPSQQLGFKSGTVFCPHGASGSRNGFGLQQVTAATDLTIQLLYAGVTPPETSLTPQERNKLIRELYKAGETLQALAKRFGISHQRVHQIIHRRRK